MPLTFLRQTCLSTLSMLHRAYRPCRLAASGMVARSGDLASSFPFLSSHLASVCLLLACLSATGVGRALLYTTRCKNRPPRRTDTSLMPIAGPEADSLLAIPTSGAFELSFLRASPAAASDAVSPEAALLAAIGPSMGLGPGGARPSPYIALLRSVITLVAVNQVGLASGVQGLKLSLGDNRRGLLV